MALLRKNGIMGTQMTQVTLWEKRIVVSGRQAFSAAVIPPKGLLKDWPHLFTAVFTKPELDWASLAFCSQKNTVQQVLWDVWCLQKSMLWFTQRSKGFWARIAISVDRKVPDSWRKYFAIVVHNTQTNQFRLKGWLSFTVKCQFASCKSDLFGYILQESSVKVFGKCCSNAQSDNE